VQSPDKAGISRSTTAGKGRQTRYTEREGAGRTEDERTKDNEHEKREEDQEREDEDADEGSQSNTYAITIR
jgi:hypothetical protein